MKDIIIAIDGPSGSGKSTVSRQLAKRLNYIYLDTGAMYRCVALKIQRSKLKIQNCFDEEEIKKYESEIVEIAKSCDIKFKDDKIFLDGEDVSDKIRTQDISNLASSVSTIKGVREILWEMQREIGKQGKIVAEGRDVGTVVFPSCEVKIFLTASLEERVRRRYKELKERGLEVDFETLKNEVKSRDLQDSNRLIAPLKKADDALEINTDNLTPEEVVDKLVQIVLKKIEEGV